MKKPDIERCPATTGGKQKIWRFANNYGASVVQHSFSYGGRVGLWELAVVGFTGPELDRFDIRYDTGITTDVLGSLDDAQVQAALELIEQLPPFAPSADGENRPEVTPQNLTRALSKLPDDEVPN